MQVGRPNLSPYPYRLPICQHTTRLEKWFDEWSICLNVKKCKIMHLGKDNPRRPYYMFDKSTGTQIQLETTSFERDLGIIISDRSNHK